MRVTHLGFSQSHARQINGLWKITSPAGLTKIIRSLVHTGSFGQGGRQITPEFITQYINESAYTGSIVTHALRATGARRGHQKHSDTMSLVSLAGDRAMKSMSRHARAVNQRYGSWKAVEEYIWLHQAMQCSAASLAGKPNPLLVIGIECIGSSSMYGEMANAWFSAQPGGPKERAEFSVTLG